MEGLSKNLKLVTRLPFRLSLGEWNFSPNINWNPPEWTLGSLAKRGLFGPN